uniref:TSC22 domain family member 4 n=1 Tax=Paramormyrops kingsleyae TaxID=1676925 RepID=A0A3B3TCF9_9TELE|nr:TSC22 domain family protein 4 isoform X2 [Paramormyrops kingsleyae]
MSGGKKKSGFQITSVTLEYGQASGEPSPPPASMGKEVAGGTGTDRFARPDDAGDHKLPARSGSLGGDEVVRGKGSAPNGPTLLDVIRTVQPHTSCSQPSTPAAVRRQTGSQDSVGAQSPQASRFRVVRLGHGLGEPYRRGRWTCVDFLEREGGEERGLRRVMDSMRHAHSLESLETVGLGGAEGPGGGALLKPLGHVRALRAGHLVHSQGTTHLRAPHLGGGADELLAKPRPSSSGPPSPSSSSPSPSRKERFSVRLVSTGSLRSSLSSPTSQPPEPPVFSPPRYRHVPAPLQLDMDMGGKPLFRETLSQPSSPGPSSSRDGAFQQSANPVPTPSALSLAQSVFGVGGTFDLSDDSGSSTSMIAIDNKIEQAMDLVKTHLMMAVREEVEVLREQIKELTERNAQLERENYILRALQERD